MEFFDKNLKFLRKQANLTQLELALILDYSTRDMVAKLEGNEAKPSYEVLLKIKHYFNVSLDDLVCKDLSRE